MSELRQAVEAVKTQGKFHRAFLMVVDALDRFENFEVTYNSAENEAAQARDRLLSVQADLKVAEVDKGVLTAEVEALHIEKARASNAATQDAKTIISQAQVKAADIIDTALADARKVNEETLEAKYRDKDAHDVQMASYAEQQHEAFEHLKAVKEELAALKARFDA